MQLYDHGTLLGNDDEQKREKDKKVFALLSLLTKDNARAQAFLVRYKRDEEAANRTLSGDDAFKKMDAMFHVPTKSRSREIESGQGPAAEGHAERVR